MHADIKCKLLTAKIEGGEKTNAHPNVKKQTHSNVTPVLIDLLLPYAPMPNAKGRWSTAKEFDKLQY